MSGLLEIYLIISTFTPYTRIFHFFNGDQHFGKRKPGNAREELLAIRRFLEELLTYGGRGSQINIYSLLSQLVKLSS